MVAPRSSTLPGMSKEKGARSRRFGATMDPLAAKMNASVGFDRRLLSHDVRGSIAHARGLHRIGLLSDNDLAAIEKGLAVVEAQFSDGTHLWDESLEDVHMNVESQLVNEIGDAGKRLHTGRSRNDQVATDMRLYARDSCALLVTRLANLQTAFVDVAEQHKDDVMPGYTHLQRAQPVTVAHHMLAYAEMFDRDKGRIHDAAARANCSPLGSGALAGTTFPLDRQGVAKSLDFADITHNSLDAVGDRDFVAEILAAIALCQVHLSRLGEEIILWLSQEFGFASVSEAYCSASSLMPQKSQPRHRRTHSRQVRAHRRQLGNHHDRTQRPAVGLQQRPARIARAAV